MPISLDEYRKAIEVAERDLELLHERLKELNEIRNRASQLESFIKLGKMIISQSEITRSAEMFKSTPTESVQRELIPKEEIHSIDKPHIDGIYEILKETGKPMSLREIADEFRKRHWKLSEANGIQVLRAAILRKPEMFSKDAEGITFYYSLINSAESTPEA